MTQLPYVLEVAIGIGLGAMVYTLWFRKLGLFQWRRFFLLFWPLLCFIIPLLEFERIVESGSISNPEATEMALDGNAHLDQEAINLFEQFVHPLSANSGLPLLEGFLAFFLKIYWIGALIFLLIFLWKAMHLLHFLKQGKADKKGDYTILESSDYKAAATFGKYILKRKGEQLHPMILAHELVHVRQKHTLDILWMELLNIFQWFNPLIYFLHKELKETHEFIADQVVVQQYNKASYARLLVQQVQSGATPALSIPFATFTKKRLIAMKTKTHHKMTKFRFLLLLPATLCLLAFFSMKNVEKPTISEGEAPLLENQTNLDLLSLAAVPQLPKTVEPGDAIFPVQPVKVTSSFGPRIHPQTKKKNHHRGIDFKAPTGTPVMAAFSGTIKAVESHKEGYGKHIIIDHGDGLTTQYAHLDAFSVELGEKVTQGQKIGDVGNTGFSLGPHLHFEIIKDGKPVDPEKYLPKIKD